MSCYKSSSFIFFFFKQKTAYEMRISDWSSDVCSSDLLELGDLVRQALGHLVERLRQPGHVVLAAHEHAFFEPAVGEPARDPRRRPDQIGRASCRERVWQYV